MSEVKVILSQQLTIGDKLIYWDDGVRYAQRKSTVCRPCEKSCSVRSVYFGTFFITAHLANGFTVVMEKDEECRLEVDETTGPMQAHNGAPTTFRGVSID